VNREVLDRWCERGILALILAILVFGPLAYGAVDTVPFLIVQGLTAAVLLLWIGRLWLNPRPQFLWPPICWAVLAFTLYAIGRYFTADIEYVARQELIRVLVYAFLFFAILNNLHRQEFIQIAVLTLVFLAMAISGYAIYQYVANSDKVWFAIKPYAHRGSGTYISPNHLGGFLEMLLPLGLAFTLSSRLNHVAKILVGYASLAILAGIAVTVSRGSWIATILAVLLFFVVLSFHRAHRLAAFLALLVIIGGGAYVIPKSQFFHQRARQLVNSQTRQIDDDARFDIWSSAYRMWRENPWWGVGPAHFDRRFRAFRPANIQMQPDRAHNDILNTLADWGIVGAVLVSCAFVLLGVGIAKTWPAVRVTQRDIGEKKRSNKFAFVLGASIGLVAILLHSLVDFNMHVPANAIVAITLMALLSSYLRFATDQYWKTLRPGLKATASTILFLGLVYLGQQDWRLGSEYVWLNRAEEAPPYSPEQVVLLTKAFAIEPNNPDTAFKIGEGYRVQSKEGGMRYEGQDLQGLTYQDLATRALQWFERSSKLDPWNAYNFANHGWCLDWLGRQTESAPYFDQANQLDPNGYYTLAMIGMHYFDIDDPAASKPWFERSVRLQWEDNPISRTYLQLANQKLMDAATNDFAARLNSLHQ
jgi:Lipid A core - O-antigen ligase and related enzymes